MTRSTDRQFTPVAQYVRMSTEHQKYSIANQEDRLAEFATDHQMAVVKTYRDWGKSGVTIRGRAGLQALIRDVHSANRGFEAVLVFDVTRWGRFQDTDEGAYYEFVCKRAGAPVIYCEESFTGYDGPMTTVVKSVKRAMAAEFSRELGAKVYAGQRRLLQLGYWQGGPAGYAMRRYRVSEDGKRHPLRPGQRKVLQTDRVVVGAGLASEVAVVRKIFRWFVIDRLNEVQIARRLNRSGCRTQHGKTWFRESVTRVIQNEIYAGVMTWSRHSKRLGGLRVSNPQDTWARGRAYGVPIVTRARFDAAQRIIASRKSSYLDQRMLYVLRQIYRDFGKVSTALINDCPYSPYYAAYIAHFGSLANACALAGVPSLCRPGNPSGRRDARGRFSGP